MPSFQHESLHADLGNGESVHLLRIPPPAGTPERGPALLLHGAIGNSRIFCSNSGKGFGPYLARLGYDVYAGDLRGRGRSRPPVSRASAHGQHESITREIPAMSELVATRTGGAPQAWIAHSWGGVLMMSALARFPDLRRRVRALAFFGTKRCVRSWSLDRALKIELYWKRLAPLAARFYGYLPAREWGIGADNETRSSLAESIAWVKPGPWVDPRDGFDYAAALRADAELPPALYVAGKRDACLGNPRDVRDFVAEAGPPGAELRLVDFGHVDMLASVEAERVVYPMVADWLASAPET